MKLNHLLRYLMFFVAGAFMFSCSSGKYYEYSNNAGSYHSTYVKTDTKAAPVKAEAPEVKSERIAEAPQVLEASNTEMPASLLKPESNWKASTAPEVKKVEAPAPVMEQAATETKVAPLYTAPSFKVEKKEEKKGFFAKIGQKMQSAKASVLEIILAIFLPPIAVLLHDGVGTYFWISIILWLLFIVPGIIFALLVVTDNI